MHRQASFEKQFSEWLDDCLLGHISPAVRAFTFGVCKRELCFAVELNGTAEFHAQSSGWTWSEIWQPEQSKFYVPPKVCCGLREHCSTRLGQAIVHYLEHGIYSSKLLSREGIAIDHIDEGYELLWSSATHTTQTLHKLNRSE